jgi:hypothetical protein
VGAKSSVGTATGGLTTPAAIEAGAASEGAPVFFSAAHAGAAGTNVMQRNAAV